jgi:RND family efflux transporter MFP subunit
MNYKSGVLTGVVASFALMGSVAAGWWLLHGERASAEKPAAPAPPAKVGQVAKEDEFNLVKLTREAQGRLGLSTGKVERRAAPRQRVYGGEVTVPPGQAIIVSAPLGGILKAPEGGVPAAGSTVKKGRVVYQLVPLLTPEGRVNLASAQIDADGQIKSAETQVEATKIALDRAQRMLKNDTGSKAKVDDAQAAYNLAVKALEVAKDRRAVLLRAAGEIEKGTAAALPIESPEDGLLRGVTALAGQTVPSGAALFEVVNVDKVWVRVPVYVGDIPDLNTRQDALAGNLAGGPGQKRRAARPIPAPPSANAANGTADLYYEVDNREARFRPGERISMSLPVVGEAESLTVPWSAVVFDVHGGAWVYEQAGERAYRRRRVLVHHVAGETAVLDAGPAPGTPVVTAGAAELFGTEVGFGK